MTEKRVRQILKENGHNENVIKAYIRFCNQYGKEMSLACNYWECFGLITEDEVKHDFGEWFEDN